MISKNLIDHYVMLLSAASDAQVGKLIAMGAIIVVVYLIVPLIRRIRDNARKNRSERSKINDSGSGYDYYKSSSKKYLLYAVISIAVAVLSLVLARLFYIYVLSYLFYLGLLVAFVFFILGIVNLLKGKNN